MEAFTSPNDLSKPASDTVVEAAAEIPGSQLGIANEVNCQHNIDMATAPEEEAIDYGDSEDDMLWGSPPPYSWTLVSSASSWPNPQSYPHVGGRHPFSGKWEVTRLLPF